MECHQELNLERCVCNNTSCARRDICCECIRHHASKRQLPGCVFPPDPEKTCDRSFEHFARLVNQGLA